MVESKSVKVDNWGVFFLQKLQNFFNKTDYCDLTLQFMDNSQLKVHRLVLSACTDYFNVLEQQCDMTDDILVMPYDLQADVVVPIVNFMYTGTLEFEVNMYARLLKTAKDMNMTVLLKLLEAHKRTVNVSHPVRTAPVLLNKGAQRSAGPAAHARFGVPQRAMQHRAIPASPARIKAEMVRGGGPRQAPSFVRKDVPETVRLVTKYGASSTASQVKGPSRFQCNEEQVNPDQFESSFDNISYESRPLITASAMEERTGEASGSFEQLRKGYTGVKRPASRLGSESPPEKRPNIQDVKEYTEAHKMRKKIVAEEFNEDDDDDDREDYVEESGHSNETTLIGGKGADNVDHAKIINEVLKKYPHLVKNNKNIKLKITQKGQQQTITAPLRSIHSSGPSSSSTPKALTTQAKLPTKHTVTEKIGSPPAEPTAKPTLVQKPTKTVVNEAVAPVGPKKIDSRTMHALIAKGAENTTGPWLCLKCGVNGRPISIPSYKGFRRHLINVHKLKIDPKLCEHCGWKSTKKEELHHHILVVHNINPPPDMKFPKCTDCNFVAIDANDLKSHDLDKHPSKTTKVNAQHCIYCNKTFNDENRLYDHMRSNHRDRAREDGVMDTDDEDLEDEDEYVPNIAQQSTGSVSENSKIKVLSNITLPAKGMQYTLDSQSQSISSIGGSILEPSSEAEGLSNVATGIATSLGILDTEQLKDENNSSQDESNISGYLEDEMANVHGEVTGNLGSDTALLVADDVTRFVTEEGSTLDLTETQKAELIQQLQDQQGVVMVLNNDAFAQDQEDAEGKTETADDDQLENKAADIITTDTSEIEDTPLVSIQWEIDGTNVVPKDPENKSVEGEENVNENIDEIKEEVEDSVTNDAEPTASASATKKLIEGDWSDDEDSRESAQPATSHSSKVNDDNDDVLEISASHPTRSYKGREGRSSKDSIKEPSPSQDSGIEEKTQFTIKDKETEEKAEAHADLDDESLNIDVPETDEEELKKASKIEIKTLINDWGDDDDDDDHLE